MRVLRWQLGVPQGVLCFPCNSGAGSLLPPIDGGSNLSEIMLQLIRGEDYRLGNGVRSAESPPCFRRVEIVPSTSAASSCSDRTVSTSAISVDGLAAKVSMSELCIGLDGLDE